jgi:ABC-type phosphate transport system substrate-binding protein
MRLLALITFCLSVAAIGRAQDASFVVNKDTKVASVSAEDIKNILLGNKLKFEDGTVIKLAILTDGPIHEKVVRDYTQRSTDQFDKYWKRLVFTGKGIMAAQFKSDADLIDYVTKTPGGFGYVAMASVTGAVTAVEIK